MANRRYYRDFREHLKALEEQGKLIRIQREINKDTELMPLVRWQFRGLDEEQRKAFLSRMGSTRKASDIRCPEEDILVVKGKSPGLDPSAHPPGMESLEVRMASIGALLINAVRPWPYTPASLPRKKFMEKSKAIWEELGLPALKPRMPWYGYSLGAWSKQDEEEAELAVNGDYFATGDKQKGQRTKP